MTLPNGAGGQPSEQPFGELELVHAFTAGPMPTGVTVSRRGRIFVNFPKWGDDVTATVVELRDGEAVPYPDERWNGEAGDEAGRLVSVQSVVVDPLDRLWILDTGSPLFRPPRPGGPKLVRVDLADDTVAQVVHLQPDVALGTTYLNDVRFDLRKGESGCAYITDSSDKGPNGIIVVDLATGQARRRLHDDPTTKAETPPGFVPLVEGRPFMERPPDGPPKPVTMGADGIAISADGRRLYYCPLLSRSLYSVSADALTDPSLSEEEIAATVAYEGDRGGAADGLESDDAGRVYMTNWEHNAVLRRHPDGTMETLVHDPRLLWPDTLSVTDGYVYVTANQLHRQARFQNGRDLRRHPYALYRIPIDAGPVRLLP
ncbi:L-dopachrome tautomerase-related protein [Nonomuraea candida]|uniref:L-dopachrome tautomerase-related protein n=1 Tax=Nonomuraea candida TaxID=359159 RepID=UPI0005BB667C|nr:L-dopachrome tautomerase-related protein [Nonomuraea candida]